MRKQRKRQKPNDIMVGGLVLLSRTNQQAAYFAEARANKGAQRSIPTIFLRPTAVRLFGLDGHSTHAPRFDPNGRKGHRRRKLSLHASQFFDGAALLQTFRQAVERPNIVGML